MHHYVEFLQFGSHIKYLGKYKASYIHTPISYVHDKLAIQLQFIRIFGGGISKTGAGES